MSLQLMIESALYSASQLFMLPVLLAVLPLTALPEEGAQRIEGVEKHQQHGQQHRR